MGLFRKAEPKRIVLKLPKRTIVKVYGPGSFLGLMNPVMTSLMIKLGFCRTHKRWPTRATASCPPRSSRCRY
jgi:hypothetical protein